MPTVERDALRKRLPLLSNGRRQVPCMGCGVCCTYVAIEIDPPTTLRRAPQLLWFLYHDQISIYADPNGEWYIQLETPCQHLTDDMTCGIYAVRPHTCRTYDARDCEINVEDEGMYIRTSGEFLAYLQKRRKRLYAQVSEGFVPPEATQDGQVLRKHKRLPPFDLRYRRMRTLGQIS
jgi:Fe-S-cluster containining protein